MINILTTISLGEKSNFFNIIVLTYINTHTHTHTHTKTYINTVLTSGLPQWLSSKESACNGKTRRHQFNPWVRKVP